MKLLMVHCDCLDEIVNMYSCQNCEHYKGIKGEFLNCAYDDIIEPLEEELEIIP